MRDRLMTRNNCLDGELLDPLPALLAAEHVRIRLLILTDLLQDRC